MKKLLILATLLTSFSSFAITLGAGAAIMKDPGVDEISGQLGGVTTSGSGVVTGLIISTVGSPVAGLVVLADNGTTFIDFENENALDEVLLIQIALEDGEELSEMQEAFLEIGMANGQLDVNANVIE
jgi:hypothetical protein